MKASHLAGLIVVSVIQFTDIESSVVASIWTGFSYYSGYLIM